MISNHIIIRDGHRQPAICMTLGNTQHALGINIASWAMVDAQLITYV